MAEFHPALPHGPLREIFPDIFFVTGSFRIAPLLTIPRNMTVVRHGTSLTVLNSVRLDAAGEAKLDALGKVEHVVRVGHFHGYDDAYYVDRYKAQLWAPAKLGVPGAKAIEPGATPIPGSTVFVFEKGKVGEVAVILDVDGGALVTCDSYQHWTSYDGASLLGKLVLKVMGFQPKHIGAPWTKEMGRGVREDFDRLLALPWKHLIPAHGAVLTDTAQDGLREAITKRFGG